MNKSNYVKIGMVIGAVGFAVFLANNVAKDQAPQVLRPTPVKLMPYASPTYAANATDIESCEKNGGDWGVWGLAAREYCQYPAADGDKECTDGSQCSLGNCISLENTSPGNCQTYEQTFGCYSFIEDGKVSSAICID